MRRRVRSGGLAALGAALATLLLFCPIVSAGTPQTITFSPPPSQATAGSSYTVSAKSSSGLAVYLKPGGVCSLTPPQANAEVRLGKVPERKGAVPNKGPASEVTVYFLSAGTCTIDAVSFGTAEYGNAEAVQSFTVAKDPSERITFLSSAPRGAVVGRSYAPVVRSSAGVGVSFSSAPRSVCGVVIGASSSSVRFVGAGTCTIDVRQQGASESQAPEAHQSFTVGQDVASGSTTTHSRTVEVPVSCPATAISSCKITVRLTAKRRRSGRHREGLVTVGGAQETLLGGRRGTLKASLNAIGDRLLRKHHHLTVDYMLNTIPETLTGTLVVHVYLEGGPAPPNGCFATKCPTDSAVYVSRVGAGEKVGPNKEILSSIETREQTIAVAPGEYEVALSKEHGKKVTVAAGQTVEVTFGRSVP